MVSHSQAKYLIQKALAYQILKAGNNVSKKNTIRRIAKEFEKIDLSGSQPISRAEFASYLLQSQKVALVSAPAVWNDESGKFQTVISTLRVKYGFIWLDPFGQNYFQ